jgi:hypothetical protein
VIIKDFGRNFYLNINNGRNVEMKKCSKCCKTKELTEFNKNKYSKAGLSSWCKPCKVNWQTNYLKSYNKTPKGKQTQSKWVYKISGVYGIFENGDCLYVGESKRVNARITEHKVNIKRFQQNTHKHLYESLSQHPHIIFGVLEETPNHKEREQYWINKLKPKYNA